MFILYVVCCLKGALKVPQNTTESMMSDHTAHGRNKFEWLFLGEASQITHSYDRPIWETDHFAVLPSLGSIVSGWLLIVPKFPVCRIADVDSWLRNEFEALAHKTIRSVERDFGRAYLFERYGQFEHALWRLLVQGVRRAQPSRI